MKLCPGLLWKAWQLCGRCVVAAGREHIRVVLHMVLQEEMQVQRITCCTLCSEQHAMQQCVMPPPLGYQLRNMTAQHTARHAAMHDVDPGLPHSLCLQERMKVRHRDGFRPPQRGRRTDVEGDAPKQRWAERNLFVASAFQLWMWRMWPSVQHEPLRSAAGRTAVVAWPFIASMHCRPPRAEMHPHWGVLPR